MAAPKKIHAISPETLGILTDESTAGAGAETLLRTLGPVLDNKLDALLMALETAAPELNTLLDLRAKISTVRSLRRELVQTARLGRESAAVLTEIYSIH